MCSIIYLTRPSSPEAVSYLASGSPDTIKNIPRLTHTSFRNFVGNIANPSESSGRRICFAFAFVSRFSRELNKKTHPYLKYVTSSRSQRHHNILILIWFRKLIRHTSQCRFSIFRSTSHTGHLFFLFFFFCDRFIIVRSILRFFLFDNSFQVQTADNDGESSMYVGL